jgi:hypothetical protein
MYCTAVHAHVPPPCWAVVAVQTTRLPAFPVFISPTRSIQRAHQADQPAICTASAHRTAAQGSHARFRQFLPKRANKEPAPTGSFRPRTALVGGKCGYACSSSTSTAKGSAGLCRPQPKDETHVYPASTPATTLPPSQYICITKAGVKVLPRELTVCTVAVAAAFAAADIVGALILLGPAV